MSLMRQVTVDDSLLQLIARKADGDARKALNLLDACCSCACKTDSKYDISSYSYEQRKRLREAVKCVYEEVMILYVLQ